MAWNVSTEPENRSALIEEFTGIHCPNCPDGHKRAAMLMSMHPGEVYTAAIHAGGFANAAAGEPNFITPLSTFLDNHFRVSFYPAGTVSRHETVRGLVQNRNWWGETCREVTGLASPVNLWTECSYDAATRTVTLNVEGYLTDDMTDPRLNVFILQSEILGPQQGGGMGIEYPHRHQLRGRLTDADMGDAITEKTKGEYFSRTFTYVVPEKIETIDTDVPHMALLTFVTDGDHEVMKVAENRLIDPQAEGVLKATATEAAIPMDIAHGFDFVEVFLNNHGTVDITDARFDITLNDEKNSYSWEGLVPAKTNQLVRIPLYGLWKDMTDNVKNSYKIKLTKANGVEQESAVISGTFGMIKTWPNELTLRIKTDANVADNTWRILDEQGEVVKEFGPYEADKDYIEEVSLEVDKVYCLEVTDCWGDGLLNLPGYLKVFDKEGSALVRYEDIKNYGMRSFFRTKEATQGGNDVSVGMTVAEGGMTEYYDLAGRKVSDPRMGVYVKRTVSANGTATVEKVIIK